MKQSTYYSSSPEQTAAQFLKQTRRAKAACIALLAGLAALLLLLFGLFRTGAISDMVFLVLELIIIVCAVGLHAGFRRRAVSRFTMLQDVLLTDCDPGKYLAAMKALLHNRAFRRAYGTLTLECAAAHYYLDELGPRRQAADIARRRGEGAWQGCGHRRHMPSVGRYAL